MKYRTPTPGLPPAPFVFTAPSSPGPQSSPLAALAETMAQRRDQVRGTAPLLPPPSLPSCWSSGLPELKAAAEPRPGVCGAGAAGAGRPPEVGGAHEGEVFMFMCWMLFGDMNSQFILAMAICMRADNGVIKKAPN